MELFLNWFIAIALLPVFLQLFSFFQSQHISGCKHTVIALYLFFFLQPFFAIVVTCCFLQLFFWKSHCDKVAITHMLVFSNSFLLQSPNISGCNRTVTYFATTRIFIRLQHNQANTNLVAI
jgi:hypothetical protein